MKFKEIIKAYPVALASLTAFILFLGLGFWRSSQEDDLQDLLKTREQESARLASNVHNAAKLNTQLEQLADFARAVQDRLANPGDLAGNQQYFYKFESDDSVKLNELHQLPSSVRPGKRKLYNFYSLLPYSIKVQGDYLHVLKFLRSIENGPRFSIVDTASIDVGGALKRDEDVSDSTPIVLTVNVELLATP